MYFIAVLVVPFLYKNRIRVYTSKNRYCILKIWAMWLTEAIKQTCCVLLTSSFIILQRKWWVFAMSCNKKRSWVRTWNDGRTAQATNSMPAVITSLAPQNAHTQLTGCIPLTGYIHLTGHSVKAYICVWLLLRPLLLLSPLHSLPDVLERSWLSHCIIYYKPMWYVNRGRDLWIYDICPHGKVVALPEHLRDFWRCQLCMEHSS